MNFGKYALLALAGAGLLTFASCGKDEKKAAPVIKVMHETTELKGTLKEADFPILVVATPADDVKELSFMVTYTQEGGQTGEQKSQKISGKKESLGYTGKIKKEDLPTGIKKGTIIISAKGSDATGKLEVNFDFNADNGGGNGGGNDTPAKNWGEVKNGWLNHKAADGCTAAWNLKDGEALEIKANVDHPEKLYMMNVSTGKSDKTTGEFFSTFTSEVAKFSTEPKKVSGNGCMFVNVKSGLNFETATVADVEAKATGMSKAVENPAENDVIIAKHNDELYLIKITKISKTGKTTRVGEGYMQFQYKAKK